METWILTTKESRAKYRDYPLGTKAHAAGGRVLSKGRKGLEVGNKRVRISNTIRGRRK